MHTPFKKFLASGNVFIWGCGAGVSISLLMVFGLLLLIAINGLGYFWTSDIVELTLKDRTHVMGQLAGREVIPRSVTPNRPEGKGRLRVKVGNRDIYGLDFKWVNDDQIESETYPTDIVLLERREWGNMYARIKAVYKGETLQSEGNASGWIALAPLIDATNTLHEQITRIERVEIGSINTDIEQARLKIHVLELRAASDTRDRGKIESLKAQVADAESRYQAKTLELNTLRTEFDEYSVLMVDANGREKQIPVGQIIRALRPNEMGPMHKSWIYLTNVWSVLSTEPREANTEGGILPAIFGTVMMVMIMSLIVVPFGVLTALYLRE
jgi:phosphate transport system permease protein